MTDWNRKDPNLTDWIQRGSSRNHSRSRIPIRQNPNPRNLTRSLRNHYRQNHSLPIRSRCRNPIRNRCLSRHPIHCPNCHRARHWIRGHRWIPAKVNCRASMDHSTSHWKEDRCPMTDPKDRLGRTNCCR